MAGKPTQTASNGSSQGQTSVMEQRLVRSIQKLNDQILTKARAPILVSVDNIPQIERNRVINGVAAQLAKDLIPLMLNKEQALERLVKERAK